MSESPSPDFDRYAARYDELRPVDENWWELFDAIVRAGDLRGARFRFEYLVERDGDALADGWTAHACVDARTHRPTRVPGWLADEIATAEGR